MSAYQELIRDKVKAEDQQEHHSQEEGNRPGLFIKNNTCSGKNKQGPGNISDHYKAGDPAMPGRYQHIREVAVPKGEQPHTGYADAIVNTPDPEQTSHTGKIILHKAG